jgi:hypothetical protein
MARRTALWICMQNIKQSAADLEHWLRMNADPTRDITLLGRFDNVCIAMSEEEAQLLSLTNAGHRQTCAPSVDQVRPRVS